MTGLRLGYLLATTQGGTGRHVAMIASGCAAQGHAVRLFGPASARPAADRAGTAVAFDVVEFTDRPRPARDVAAVRRLRDLLVQARLDVVHAHGMRAGALAALAIRPYPGARWPGGRPPALVVTVHNAPPAAAGTAAIYRVLERLVARRADAVLCVSSDLSARMSRLRARRVERAVVPAPAAIATVPPGQAPPGWPAAGRPAVLAAGRLAPQKGFDTLLAAAARWRARQPEPAVVIAGSGPLAAELAGQAATLGVAPAFLGIRDDVPALLAAADVFVLPSRWEGQPLILQEALRAGRPIVATDAGGVRDLTGDAALLVPPGDPAALASAVLSILDDPDLAAVLAKAAAARAASLPTEQDAISAVLSAYQTVYARSRGASAGGWAAGC